MTDFMGDFPPWLYSLIVLVVAPLLGLIVHAILNRIATRLSHLTTVGFDETMVKHARGPTRALLPLLAFLFVLPAARLSPEVLNILQHAAGILLIATAGWAVVAALALASDLVLVRYDASDTNNPDAKRVQTQTMVLRRIAEVVVTVLAAGIILMTFPAIKHIGQSILASAGIAGLAIGLAARPALSNLIAGLQLALTSPIQLDDQVIVEGENGRIEEVRTTYVVVRTWDLRRLIVPLNYFIENPFQNWTRTSTSMIGAVVVYTDYHVPIAAIREQLTHIVKGTDLWDGNTVGVQVTDATDRAVQVRVLVSASDAGKAWDLRCLVREALLEFLQAHYADNLPRARVELRQLGAGPATAAAA